MNAIVRWMLMEMCFVGSVCSRVSSQSRYIQQERNDEVYQSVYNQPHPCQNIIQSTPYDSLYSVLVSASQHNTTKDVTCIEGYSNYPGCQHRPYVSPVLPHQPAFNKIISYNDTEHRNGWYQDNLRERIHADVRKDCHHLTGAPIKECYECNERERDVTTYWVLITSNTLLLSVYVKAQPQKRPIHMKIPVAATVDIHIDLFTLTLSFYKNGEYWKP